MKLLTPAQWLTRETRKSDIRANSPTHPEIGAMLRSHGLDIFFWRFERRRFFVLWAGDGRWRA